MNKKVKTYTYASFFLALSLLFGYIESVIPISIGDVGIKLGLSNLVTILALKILDTKKALLINILRLIILGILFGNLVRFILSVSGFIVSFIIMVLFLKLKFSVVFSSILGGVFHNIGQFIALIFIINNTKVLYLIPAYIIVGIATGLIIGILANTMLKYINLKKGV